jgi:hypothetical protein
MTAPPSWLLAEYDPYGSGKCGKCMEQFSARPSLDIKKASRVANPDAFFNNIR